MSNSNLRAGQERGSQVRNLSLSGDPTIRCRHCSKVIAQDTLEEHETFFCPLKPVRCPHFKANGELCGFLCSGPDALRDHCKNCKDHPRKRRAVSVRDSGSPRCSTSRVIDFCEDCQETFADRAALLEHVAVCPLKSVPCPLLCGVWMPRHRVPDHILTTAVRHKPLRRPSTSDYGADNIHMVVAVLMEALQNAKKAAPPPLPQHQQQQQQQQQRMAVVYEETMSNITPGMSFNDPFLPHSGHSAEVPSRSSKSFASSSMRGEAGEESSPPHAGAAICAAASVNRSGSSESEGARAEEAEGDTAAVVEPSPEAVVPLEKDDAEAVVESVSPPKSPAGTLIETAEAPQDTQPPLNVAGAEQTAEALAAPQRSAQARKRKAAAAGNTSKSRRNSGASNSAALLPQKPMKAAFRASAAAATTQPSKLRYEDFLANSSEQRSRRPPSPPASVRLRPPPSRPPLSPRARAMSYDPTVSPRAAKTTTTPYAVIANGQTSRMNSVA